jgi:hypothetical protein
LCRISSVAGNGASLDGLAAVLMQYLLLGK